MAIRVLVTDGMDAGAMEQLRKDGFEVVEQFYEPDQLGAALKDFDAVIIRSATKIKKQQIDDAKGGKLKLIIRAGVGMDNIDIPYAEAAGIACRNTPRASSNAVAELAISLLFSCARSISIAGHTMRENKWEKKAYSKGFEVSGKTVGVIGYGRIGRMVGDKCQALGAKVLSVVHRTKPEGCECETMHFVSMDELLSQLHEEHVGGAMLCDYDFFRVLYRSEARSISRTGHAAHICLLSVTAKDGVFGVNILLSL